MLQLPRSESYDEHLLFEGAMRALQKEASRLNLQHPSSWKVKLTVRPHPCSIHWRTQKHTGGGTWSPAAASKHPHGNHATVLHRADQHTAAVRSRTSRERLNHVPGTPALWYGFPEEFHHQKDVGQAATQGIEEGSLGCDRVRFQGEPETRIWHRADYGSDQTWGDCHIRTCDSLYLPANQGYATGEMIKYDDHGLIAMNSKVGRLVSGPLSPDTTHLRSEAACHMVDIGTPSAKELNGLLPKLWELDRAGSSDRDPDTDQVLREFTNTIEYNDSTGRYVVRFPWRENKYQLPSNFGLSHNRLISLQWSLEKRDPELMVKYDQHIQDQLQLGFIEKVPDSQSHTGVLHYIPHLPVFKQDSATTKMRIVYDASAKRSDNSLSLNGCLHAGPNLLQGLTGILLKFRVHPIAFVADIEKAFLLIELNAADRDATRFLWLKDVTQSARDLTNVDVFRFCRVLFGAAPSPFLLGATIHHHLDRHGDDWISQDLKAAMYMDNVVTGTASDSQALEYYARSRTLLHRAGMNLRQWKTNSQPLRDQVRRGGTGAASTVKVLGLMWDSDCDTLSLSLKAVLEDTKNLPTLTKRFALSAVASIFDPLGLAEPFIVKAKIMIQELWTQKLSWDEPLSIILEGKWRTWLDDIKRLLAVAVPRPYFASIQGQLQLEIFCDSSPAAYGAVAYLRQESLPNYRTALVMAKSRVAPLKQKTLPFLELLAALLGARFCEYVTDHLPENMTIDKFLWSDSQIVLTWITSQKPLPRKLQLPSQGDQSIRLSLALPWHLSPHKDRQLATELERPRTCQTPSHLWRSTISLRRGDTVPISHHTYSAEDTPNNSTAWIIFRWRRAYPLQRTSSGCRSLLRYPMPHPSSQGWPSHCTYCACRSRFCVPQWCSRNTHGGETRVLDSPGPPVHQTAASSVRHL